MHTLMKISITGPSKVDLRRSITALLSTEHFRRLNVAEFVSEDGMNPDRTLSILNGVYEQERKHDMAQIATIVIRSTHVNVEIKRNKNRSI